MAAKSRRYGVGEVRVIGGRLRGRKLQFPSNDGLRPTSDRMRETLFNWLQPYLPGATCLDMFAGSGALGFESLSRGASAVTLIEQNVAAFKALQENIRRLEIEGALPLNVDALRWLAQCDSHFDVVFVDPPFAADQVSLSLKALVDNHCLSDRALVYVETNDRQTTCWPSSWITLKEKISGKVCYRLLQVGGA